MGFPLFVLWAIAWGVCTAVFGVPWAFGLYVLATLLGLCLYHRVKKLLVAVGNFLFHPYLRRRFMAFRESLLRARPDESV